MTPNAAPLSMPLAVAAPSAVAVPLAMPGKPGAMFAEVMARDTVVESGPEMDVDEAGLRVDPPAAEVPRGDMQAGATTLILGAEGSIADWVPADATALQPSGVPGPEVAKISPNAATPHPMEAPADPTAPLDLHPPVAIQSSEPKGEFAVQSDTAFRDTPLIRAVDNQGMTPKQTLSEPQDVAAAHQAALHVNEADRMVPSTEDQSGAPADNSASRVGRREGQATLADPAATPAEPERAMPEGSNAGAVERAGPVLREGPQRDPAQTGKPPEIPVHSAPAPSGPNSDMPELSKIGKIAEPAPSGQPIGNLAATQTGTPAIDESAVPQVQAAPTAIPGDNQVDRVEPALSKAMPTNPAGAIPDTQISMPRSSETAPMAPAQAIAPVPPPMRIAESQGNGAPTPPADRIDIQALEETVLAPTRWVQDDAPIRVSANARPELINAPPARQIVAQVIANPSAQSVEIALHPEELGKVEIRMTGRGDEMSVQIIAQRDDTAALLRRHLPDLAVEFRQMGFTDLNFSFGGDGQDRPATAPFQGVPDAPIRMDTEITSAPVTTIQTDRLNLRV